LDEKERFIKCDEENDTTIVEIIPKDKIKDKYFLLPNLNNVNYKYKEIYIVVTWCHFYSSISLLHQIILLTYTQKYWQYPGGNASSYSSGTIKISKNNKLIYDASTKSGSSGSPIFIKDTTEVIGIHRGGFNDIKINIGNFN